MERIVETLQGLDDAGIPYCLLRNYQFLTGGEVGSDVDIAIRREDEKRVTAAFSDHGFYPSSSQSKRRHTAYKRYADGDIIKLDISWGGSEYNGLPTVDIERLLKNRRQLNGCWIPSDDDYFVQIVFHGAIKKNGYRESYEQDLERLRKTVDESKVRSHAEDLFGSLGLKAIEFALNGELERIPEMKWRLVAANCVQRHRAIPEFLYILFYENNVRKVIRRMLKRLVPSSPPIVAVTGPDGSGKSTLTTNAVSAFEKLGYDAHLVKLGLTNDSTIVMETAKAAYNRLTSYDVEEVKNVERRGEKTIGSRDGFHKAIVHFIDILLRYLKARRSGADVIIADRYIHDVGIYDNPGILARTFSWFESESTYLFLLTGDADELAERSEYTEESLDELVKRYEALDFERLDATNEPDEVLQELLDKALGESDLLRHL